jgi:hypothetical protein
MSYAKVFYGDTLAIETAKASIARARARNVIVKCVMKQGHLDFLNFVIILMSFTLMQFYI